MINKLLAAVAALSLVSPVSATVDEGTSRLINTIDDTDIVLTVNGPHCESGEFLGVYIHQGFKRELALCPGEDVDALDHAVVRHEVWHAVQHCVNVARQTPLNTPVNQDTEDLMTHVNGALTPEWIQLVEDNYPEEQWLLEHEANVAMNVLTAAEIQQLFTEACLA